MKKISKGMLMAALICGSFSVLNVASAEEMQTFEMDEFVVTAARTETRLVDTPANISVVGAQQIEEKKYQDMGEVLKDVDGVTVLDTGIGTKEKTIKLNGDDIVYVELGEEYREYGCIVSDNYDSNLNNKVVVSSNLNSSKIGEYVITYSVSDSSGNESNVNRIIEVVDEKLEKEN